VNPTAPHGCRFCGAPLEHLVLDLGVQPLCESYVTPERYWEPEPAWPLRAYVCDRCWLVQVPELVGGEAIYSHYAYFSSYSESWLAHTRRYVEMADARFGLGPESRVVEIASNDGYLLQYFLERGIPCLGVEPAANVAEAATAKGVPTVVRFFGEATARDLVAQGFQADLLVANNVIGHVPALNDFLAGLATILAPRGTLTIEIPHLLRTMAGNQFDQIYQEHYCYWSFLAMRNALGAHGLVVFDVDEIPTHGGSMRVYARHAAGRDRVPAAEAGKEAAPAVEALLAREKAAGLTEVSTYTAWNERAAETKRRLLAFLIDAKRAGRRIAAYGAPGKGNTLLNYCGVREDLVEFTVDRNPFKQGTYLPGTRIPVFAPEKLAEARPDLVLLLPWNLKEELLAQLDYVREWGGSFVIPIPEPEVIA
jgi:SAM-dependent methyltransferase